MSQAWARTRHGGHAPQGHGDHQEPAGAPGVVEQPGVDGTLKGAVRWHRADRCSRAARMRSTRARSGPSAETIASAEAVEQVLAHP